MFVHNIHISMGTCARETPGQLPSVRMHEDGADW